MERNLVVYTLNEKRIYVAEKDKIASIATNLFQEKLKNHKKQYLLTDFSFNFQDMFCSATVTFLITELGKWT